MTTFKYEAMGAIGEELTGEIEAKDSNEAQKLLRSMGYYVTKINSTSETRETYGEMIKRWCKMIGGY